MWKNPSLCFQRDLDKSETEHEEPVQIKLVLVRSSIKAAMFWSILVTKVKLLDQGNAKQEAKICTFVNSLVNSPAHTLFTQPKAATNYLVFGSDHDTHAITAGPLQDGS